MSNSPKVTQSKVIVTNSRRNSTGVVIMTWHYPENVAEYLGRVGGTAAIGWALLQCQVNAQSAEIAWSTSATGRSGRARATSARATIPTSSWPSMTGSRRT